MPRYNADLYIDGIYVKSYFIEDSDTDAAQDRAKDIADAEMMIDIEELDD